MEKIRNCFLMGPVVSFDEKDILEEMWNRGTALWKVWK